MKKAKASHPSLEKPRQPGRIRAFVLALVVHVAFFALIVVGVSWQTRPAPPIVAELWDKLPPAKSKPVEPKPAPPEPEPPKPEPPKPEPPKAEPKPEVKPEPPKPDPEIARKLEREKRERLEREKEERRKLEEAKKKQEQEAKKKQEQEKKREEERRRQEEERLRREAEQARQAAIAARQAEVDRYINLIRAKIRGRANVPDTVPTGTEAEFRIRILPGGEVLNITLTRRSGHPAYDAAIERAIRSAQPLPVPPANSELFPQFRDLTLHMTHER